MPSGRSLAVVDVEHEQLLLGNFADEINVRALVVQVNIDAVHGQTNAVAVYGVYDLERLTHAVDAPLLVADRLEGQLDTVRLRQCRRVRSAPSTESSKISFSFLMQISLVTVGTTMIYGLPICCATFAAEGEQLYELSHSSGVQKLMFSMELNANGLIWLFAKKP